MNDNSVIYPKNIDILSKKMSCFFIRFFKKIISRFFPQTNRNVLFHSKHFSEFEIEKCFFFKKKIMPNLKSLKINKRIRDNVQFICLFHHFRFEMFIFLKQKRDLEHSRILFLLINSSKFIRIFSREGLND